MQTPNNKVTGVALAGAVTIIIVWILRLLADIEVPGEAAAALTTVFTFVTGYFVREPVSDQ